MLTKVATKKTAGAVGLLRNKAILLPVALAVSAFLPWAFTPLPMTGGAFLCFEGFEKHAHRFRHGAEENAAPRRELASALTNLEVDFVAFERERIRGAVRTDFILSAEVIAITLGTATGAPPARDNLAAALTPME